MRIYAGARVTDRHNNTKTSGHRIGLCPLLAALVAMTLGLQSAFAQQVWQVRDSTITLFPAYNELSDLGVEIDPSQSLNADDHASPQYLIDPDTSMLVELTDNGEVLIRGRSFRLRDGILLATENGGFTTADLSIAAEDLIGADRALAGSTSAGALSYELRGVKAVVDAAQKRMTLFAHGVVLTPATARSMGLERLAGVSIGQLQLDADVEWVGGDEPVLGQTTDVGGGTASAAVVGPDMKFCQLFGLTQFGRLGSVVGLGLATTSWNVGDAPLLWFQNPDERHPFIVGNVYRIKDDRFEQIGQSWVKHAFCALDSSQCTTSCQGTGCTTLGVGCTDTYGAGLNANRTYLGPRYEVDPWTGSYTYPGSHLSNSHSHNAIDHRLQVHDDDLNQTLNAGASYLAEGYYVCLDDVNVMNSISHKVITIVGAPGGTWSFGMSGSGSSPTDGPAILSWPGATFTTIAQELPVVEFVSPDGRCILGAKATGLGGGMWRYEYALYNVDMDRKVSSFSVPLAAGAVVNNIGFHAVQSHGEPFNNDPWTATVGIQSIDWTTTGNPLRWGTLYNFRFDTNASPDTTSVTLGLFEPGLPSSVSGSTVGPIQGPPDCDGDGITDACELDCAAGPCVPGTCGNSLDCDLNTIPDECDPDCNNNTLPDACDISDGSSQDCDGNGVPDECDLDSDFDGVPDACDLCPGFDDGLDADGDGIPDDCDICPNAGDVIAENQHFDTDPGWTVVNEAGLIDGPWTWGIPIGGGDRQDPPTDYDGTGACYLTDNVDGNSDVDGGPTRLLSPIYDLSIGDVTLTYAYWIGTTGVSSDFLDVEASNDGGATWVSIASYSTDNEAWLVETVDLAAILPLTQQMQLRFSATDLNPQSVFEAGIDAVEITQCVQGCLTGADCIDGNPCTIDECVAGICTNTIRDCSGMDGQCAIGACNVVTGVCFAEPAPAGTSCDDAAACTTNDVCDVGGSCAGTPADCSNLDGPCTEGACNPASGFCEPIHHAAGTPCSDGTICTDLDQCDGAGTCAGIPLDCSGLDDVCHIGVCNSLTGTCQTQPANLGGPCSDNNLCTIGDACDAAGQCVGSQLDCSELNDPCNLGVCNLADGQCTAEPVPDGLSCEDGDPCTTNDACAGGVCASSGPNVCDPPASPVAEVTPKNRYLAFVAGGTVPDGNPVVQALRVKCVNHPAFLKWVGVPNAEGLARLQCTPVYRDWGTAMINVGDADVAPQQSYIVQGIRELADPANESAYSVATTVATVAVWGDVTAGIDLFDEWQPPDSIVNITDIQAIVLGFQAMGSPPMTWVDLGDTTPNGVINFSDIQLAAQAFTGAGYPYPQPQACP